MKVENKLLPGRLGRSNRCAFCNRDCDKKTTKVCNNCMNPIYRDNLTEIRSECFLASLCS